MEANIQACPYSRRRRQATVPALAHQRQATALLVAINQDCQNIICDISIGEFNCVSSNSSGVLFNLTPAAVCYCLYVLENLDQKMVRQMGKATWPARTTLDARAWLENRKQGLW